MQPLWKRIGFLPVSGSFPLADGSTTAESGVGTSQGFPKSQFLVSWRSRTEVTTNVTVLYPVVSMLIAWIQRDSGARIWKERVTLVPPCVVMPLWNAHYLFLRFFQARMYRMSVSPTRETRYFTQKSTEMDSFDI